MPNMTKGERDELQSLIRPLVKSVGRLPAGPVTPANLKDPQPGRVSASPIGAALDLLRRFDEN